MVHVFWADASDRHPECMWTPAQDPSHVLFNCTWPGTYPTPGLSWAEERDDRGAGRNDHIYVSETTDNLPLMLNRSSLSDGQKLTCVARHITLAPGKERSCTLTLSKSCSEWRSEQCSSTAAESDLRRGHASFAFSLEP